MEGRKIYDYYEKSTANQCAGRKNSSSLGLFWIFHIRT
jgi:hypothetical protein